MEDRIAKIVEEKSAQRLTYEQLAGMSGVSKSTISRMLSGKTEPSEYTIRQLEQALGITQQPIENPILDIAGENQQFVNYVAMTNDRINRMRANHNMVMAERDRSLRNATLVIFILAGLCLALVAFICYLFLDLTHGNWGVFRDAGAVGAALGGLVRMRAGRP